MNDLNGKRKSLSLTDHINILFNSNQSSYIIIQSATSEIERGRSNSISSGPLNSHILDSKTFVSSYGNLEDDGIDQLRQSIALPSSFILVKFLNQLIFVQCLTENISAVRKARAAVMGRSLNSLISTYVNPIQVSISDPKQFNDPFLRSQIASQTLNHNTLISDAISLDVPIPVSPLVNELILNNTADIEDLNATQTFDMTIGMSMAPLSPISQKQSQSSSNSVKVRLKRSPSISTKINPKIASKFARQRLLSNPTSDEDTLDNLQTSAFPIPPERSQNAQKSIDEGKTLQRRPSSIRKLNQPPSSLKHFPSMPSLSMGTVYHKHSTSQSETISSASIQTHDSILAPEVMTSLCEEDEEEEELLAAKQEKQQQEDELESERLDFLAWKSEQEAAIIAKERQRERQRRKKDEMKRQQVMQKLLAEQNKEMKEFIEAKSSKSTSRQGSNSPQSLRSKSRSTSFAPPPPKGPPPSFPLPRSPSQMEFPSSNQSQMDNESLFGKETKSILEKLNRRRSKSFSNASLLVERLNGAIEREMKRPVIGLGGHITPRHHLYMRRERSFTETILENEKPPPVPLLPLSNVAGTDLLSMAIQNAAAQDAILSKSGKKNVTSNDHKEVNSRLIPPPISLEDRNREEKSVRIVEPQGKKIGSGWTLSELKRREEKALPSPPASPKMEEERKRRSITNFKKLLTASQSSYDTDLALLLRSQNWLSSEVGSSKRMSGSDLLLRLGVASPSAIESIQNYLENGAQAQQNSSNKAVTLLGQVFEEKLTGQSPENKFNKGLERTIEGWVKSLGSITSYDETKAKSEELDQTLEHLQNDAEQQNEIETALQLRKARDEIERQRLEAFDRLMLEKEERNRIAEIEAKKAEEEALQREIEEEIEESKKRIQEENERKIQAAKFKEIRKVELEKANGREAILIQQLKNKESEKLKKRKLMRLELSRRSEQGMILVQGLLTVQIGQTSNWKRRFFQLSKGKLEMFSENLMNSLSTSLTMDDKNFQSLASYNVSKGSILSISDAFEEVQMPHSLAIKLKLFDNSIETLLVYAESDQVKERLIVGLKFSGEIPDEKDDVF